MTIDTVPQTVLFRDLFDKPLARPVQPGAGQLRRRGDSAEGRRTHLRSGQGVRRVSVRQAGAGSSDTRAPGAEQRRLKKSFQFERRPHTTVAGRDSHPLRTGAFSRRTLKYAPYLHYDRYLAAGYPIATGVIEGACRYLVRDRMELTGARWRLVGAEAVLKLRAQR